MNETLLCLLLEMRSDSAVILFGTIFLDEMATKSGSSVIFRHFRIFVELKKKKSTFECKTLHSDFRCASGSLISGARDAMKM